MDGVEVKKRDILGYHKIGYTQNELLRLFIIFSIVLFIFSVIAKTNFILGLPILFLVLLFTLIKDTETLFYLFIISLPFIGSEWGIRKGFFFHMDYLFFILLLLSFFYNKFRNNDHSYVITKIDAPLLLFFAVATLSVFQTIYVSNNPTILYDSFRNYPWIRGVSSIIFLLFMILIYYVSVNLLSDKKILKKALFLFIFVSVILAIHSLIAFSYLTVNPSPSFSFKNPLIIDQDSTFDINHPSFRVKSVFIEPLFYGNYLLFIIPILYSLLILKSRYFTKRFVIGASLLSTIMLFLTKSRAAFLGYFAFLAVLLIYQHGRLMAVFMQKRVNLLLKRLVKISFFVILFVLLFLVILIIINPQTVKEDFGNKIDSLQESANLKIELFTRAFNPSEGKFWSTRTRLLSVMMAFNAFTEHPLLGIGYSNYIFYTGSRVYEGLYPISMNFPEVNNYPFKVLAETGILGFIVFVWLIIMVFRSFFSAILDKKKTTDNALVIGNLLSFIGVSVTLLFFSYLTLSYIWFMLAVMMVLCGSRKINLGKSAGKKDDY